MTYIIKYIYITILLISAGLGVWTIINAHIIQQKLDDLNNTLNTMEDRGIRTGDKCPEGHLVILWTDKPNRRGFADCI